MTEIQLTRGKTAIVDDEDFEYLSQWKWLCTSAGYAARGVHTKVNGKRKTKLVLMHRELCPSVGMTVDHINLNPLDNRKENLRVATHGQNMFNKPLRRDSSSGVKGVQRHGNKWRSTIGFGGKKLRLGSFDNIQDAVNAYNQAALKHHGEFAKLSEATN